MGYTDKAGRGPAGVALVSAVALIWSAAPAIAQPEPAGGAVEVSIAQGPLAEALKEVSLRTGVPVIYSEELVAGRTTRGVSGALSPDAALAGLLAGTGLEAVPGAGGYVIRERAGIGDVLAPRPAPEGALQTVPAGEAGDPRQEEDLRIDRVTVTGTSLRGIAPESSPLQIYSREDILGSGVTTTEQFIRTLPQNFGGGSTEFVRSLPNDVNTSANNTSGTGANLRGLGAGSTLILLNGRRLAPSSVVGDYIDLSMIPLSAVERVDVLTDGASSIYGGDAVAGVINFVLRDDFDGSETTFRYGRVTDGGLEEHRLGQTLGKSWSGGNILGTYEFYRRSNLALSERPSVQPFSSVGGGETPADLFDLLPAQKRHSLVVSADQEITSRLVLSASGLFTERSGFSRMVTDSGLARESDRKAETRSFSLGLDYAITPRWHAVLDATFSQLRERDDSLLYFLGDPDAFDISLKTSSDLWSADARFDGDLFAVPGGQVKVALGGHFRREEFLNGVRGAAGSRDGARDVAALYTEFFIPLIGNGNAMPGVRRLEVNASARLDDYSDFGTSSNPKIGVLWSPVEDLNFRASYSTSFAPPPLGRVGALDRTGNVQNYGAVLAQFGVEPADPSLLDLNILRTFGTDSANLGPETSRAYTAGFDLVRDVGDRSWSATATYYDIEYEGRLGQTPVPGNPPSTNLAPNLAFLNPGLFPPGSVIFNPTPAQVQAVLSTFSVPARYQNGLTPDDPIGIINNVDLIRNMALTRTRGIDAALDYSRDFGAGRLLAGLSANHILEFSRQASVTSPSVSELNTLYNPVDFQLTGRLGYAQGGLSGQVGLNYKDSYRTDGSDMARPVGSWTTVDATISYKFISAADWRRGVGVSFIAKNVFDQMPPRTPTFGDHIVPGYDPTNATPLGRFLAIEVSKAF